MPCILFLFITQNMIDNNKKTEAQTKFEAFSSRKGIICRIRDYNLPRINLNLTEKITIAIPSVRVLTLGPSEKRYFLHIEMATEYHSDEASIEYSDFKEMMKAFDLLQSCELEDSMETPDYLENHFVTDDGFRIGYYISDGETVWFMTLSKYSNESSLYMTLDSLKSVLFSAKSLFLELGAE